MAKPTGNQKPAETYPQLLDNAQQLKNTRIYRAQTNAITDERLRQLVHATTEELIEAATSEPVTLANLDHVRKRAVLYFRACEQKAVIPTMRGLARSLGLTETALRFCISKKSPAQTAEFLCLCRDAFADMLTTASAKNDVAQIPSIFLLKALYGFRESVEIVAKQEHPVLGELSDAEKLADIIEAELED